MVTVVMRMLMRMSDIVVCVGVRMVRHRYLRSLWGTVSEDTPQEHVGIGMFKVHWAINMLWHFDATALDIAKRLGPLAVATMTGN
jgi:hypothetical protein